uniref:Cytochrome c oxidase assembly homolog 18 n=1 Tax=Nothobranchius kuhntae TaxID=321403 RepID=A0A1A8JGH9_NOTKU
MLCVGGLVRSRVLYFRGQGLLRLTESVVASTTDTRTRSVSGVGGTNWAGGWYGSLSDSAPVHLCENFLVGFQQASGLPWWLSIVMATASVRTTITLPLAAYQMHIISKRVGVSGFRRLVLNGIRGFMVLMIPIAATVPSSMALYWFSSSLVGFSHNLLLRSPTVHRILRLPTQQSQSPYRDLMSAFTAKYFKK